MNAADAEWAWAACRFGWTPDQWRALTPAQRALLVKADELRTVESAEMVARAVGNAIANAFRKKGQRPRPLFRKRRKGGAKRDARDIARKMREIQERLDGADG